MADLDDPFPVKPAIAPGGGADAKVERRLALGDAEAGTRDWIDDAIRLGRPVAAMMIALSRVDLVNAAHGRDAGSALIDAAEAAIREVAEHRFPAASLVARTDGTAFVLAARADEAAITTVGRLVGEALARPLSIGDRRAVLGARVGVAVHQPGGDAADLLRRAGEALDAARGSEGTTMRVAGGGGVAPIDRLAIDLHHAIDRGEIGIVFQPQVALATGAITGVEALARWDHAALGPLGADVLFAAAGHADLGVALSDHIQAAVLARAAAWPAALGDLRLSLNLTAADVARPGFARLFLDRVAASGFPIRRLTIEITETGMIEDAEAVARLLDELRGQGCRVAIDDFGTGYSSLAYLKALPLDYLKIDRSLTVDIDGSERDRVIVRGVIAIAQGLGIEVIAEGVETEAQRDLLAADGCGYYQGFLMAGALDEAGLVALMERE